MKKINKYQLIRQVKELDPSLPRGKAFRVSLILLASLIKGPNEKAISKLLGYSIKSVHKIGRKLRSNKIWTKNKVRSNWFDEETGGMSFWLDVNCGLGFIKRTNKKV